MNIDSMSSQNAGTSSVIVNQRRDDLAALSFLAMAEHFRSSDPPAFKAAAKCLFAAVKTQASPHIKVHCHFHLGKLLLLYTRNVTTAKIELDIAYSLLKELGPQLEELRLQCACLIAECALLLQQVDCIIPLLKLEAQVSRKYPHYQAKVLLLTIEALLSSDLNMAQDIADMGIRYFKDLNDIVTEGYFWLVKCQIHAEQKKEDLLGTSVNELAALIGRIGNTVSTVDMRAFCYTVQLTYFMSLGMIVNTKRSLRQLQSTIQEMGRQPDDHPQAAAGLVMKRFNWLPKELLTGLTYVLTVLCSIQSSQFDRAEKYYNISMAHLSELNATMRKSKWGVIERGHERLIANLHFALHDGMAHLTLARGQPDRLLEMTKQMIRAIRVVPKDLRIFEGQTHFVMGLFFQYIGEIELAEAQLKSVGPTTDDPDLEAFAKITLSLLYLQQGREKDCFDTFEGIMSSTGDRMGSTNLTCTTASLFFSSLRAYAHNRIPEAQKLAIDAMSKCQEADALRMQAICMLMVARTLGARDIEAVITAKEWAVKSNDPALQAWACVMAREHYQSQPASEQNQAAFEPYRLMLQNATNMISESKARTDISQMPKFATATNYTIDLGVPQWTASIY